MYTINAKPRENGIYAGINTSFAGELYLRLLNDFEAVPVEFKIAGKVPVPPSRYHWTNINPNFRTSEARPFFFRGDIICWQLPQRHVSTFRLQSDFRPIPLIQLAPRYTYTHIDLPTGIVNIHLVTVGRRINFTPDMQVFGQVQYDNISENFAASIRFFWEYEPGKQLFASIGQSAVIPGEPVLVPQSTQASIRPGQTFRC